MKDSVTSGIEALPINLPELSLQVISLVQIGLFVLLSIMTYILSRRVLHFLTNSGILERRTTVFRTVNMATFILPGLVLFYGVTTASRDSLFVSLLFFVIFSVVIAFSLVDPAKAVFAALLINLRGDLKPGDYITIDGIEGEITSIGAFTITIKAKNGSRTYLPTHQILKTPYEIHAKKGGPSIVVNISAEKLSKQNLERLAHLCPFKRKGSDIRISTVDGQHKLAIEIVDRESRPWVIKYFDNHTQ